MAKEPESIPEAVSASLLTLASRLDEQGKVHQALTPYLKVLERYPDSQEAPLATERVLAIAEDLHERGQPHMAMAVLQRLEGVHQGR